MQGVSLGESIHEFFTSAEQSTKDDPKVKAFLPSLADTSALNNLGFQHKMEMLECLQKVICGASVSNSLAAIDTLMTCLERVTNLAINFKPDSDLLKKMKLRRLMSSDQKQTVYDLMIFILRNYQNISHQDFDLGQPLTERLASEERWQMWGDSANLWANFYSAHDDSLVRFKDLGKDISKLTEKISRLEGQVDKLKTSNSSPRNNRNFNQVTGNSNYVEKRELESLRREIQSLRREVRGAPATGGQIDEVGGERPMNYDQILDEGFADDTLDLIPVQGSDVGGNILDLPHVDQPVKPQFTSTTLRNQVVDEQIEFYVVHNDYLAERAKQEGTRSDDCRHL